MYKRTMNSLFPLLLGIIIYRALMDTFPDGQLLTYYVLAAIPAGWFMINKHRMPLTDTEYLAREIRRQKIDPLYELAYFIIRKLLKLGVAFTIGWILAPYLIFEVIYGVVQLIKKSKKVKLVKIEA